MNLSTTKNFSTRATETAGFNNETGEPRVNVEGIVQIADSLGVLTDGGGGGSSVGGGNNTYSNANGDFVATITNATKNITITGLPFTLEAIHVVAGSIKKIAVTTNAVTSLPLTNVSVSGGVITLSNASSNFVTGDTVLVNLIGPDKAYDRALDNQKIIVQNPQYGHYTSVETLVSETNLLGYKATADAGGSTTLIVDADGAFSVANQAVGYIAYQTTDGQSATISSVDSTTNITTATLSGSATWASKAYSLPMVKRYEIPMEGYNFLTLQWSLKATTNCNAYMKIYGTLDSTATADADTAWIDMSLDLLGATTGITVPVGTTATEGLLAIDTPTPLLKYMIKLVVESNTASANTNTFNVYIKKSS